MPLRRHRAHARLPPRDHDLALAPDRAGHPVTVADDLRVNGWLVIPGGELDERFSRSSGPGGQSVNTTDSRVELSFDLAEPRRAPAPARRQAPPRRNQAQPAL